MKSSTCHRLYVYVHICTYTCKFTPLRAQSMRRICVCMSAHPRVSSCIYIHIRVVGTWRRSKCKIKSYTGNGLHVYVHICTYTCTFAPLRAQSMCRIRARLHLYVRLREYMHISVYIQYTADCECVSLYM